MWRLLDIAKKSKEIELGLGMGIAGVYARISMCLEARGHKKKRKKNIAIPWGMTS